ncbi:hypothetical protein ACNAN0_10125 [Agrilactobacillus fermenti]|uniref:hypothetical protein n=1 Tax=Agrilactobacillus fermenti TaxID=2586909 RepID=UPI003A5C5B42
MIALTTTNITKLAHLYVNDQAEQDLISNIIGQVQSLSINQAYITRDDLQHIIYQSSISDPNLTSGQINDVYQLVLAQF